MMKKMTRIEHLKKENAELKAENAELKAKIAKLETRVLELEGLLKELGRRLSLDSTNSSKPPSSDGLSKSPAPQSLRKQSEKKPGGQNGSKGETLKQVEKPDTIVVHRAHSCRNCAEILDNIDLKSVIKRQIFDIVIKRNITEHQAEVKICPKCSVKNISPFPSHIKAPVEYGNNVKAMVAYLKDFHLVPMERLSFIMSDLFKITISEGTIQRITNVLSQKSAPISEFIKEAIEKSGVRHCDESGVRIEGKTSWLHVLSNKLATYFRVEKKRGAVFELSKGVMIHDCFGPYLKQGGVQHALCGAHILRELQSLIVHEKERWARAMQQLMLIVSRYAKINRAPPHLKTKTKIKCLFSKILASGFAYHENLKVLPQKKRGKPKRRRGHNLLIRLRDHMVSVLLCIEKQDVPFTNNLAERDIRMIKLKQKIAGGFRKWPSAENFCAVRSVLSTIKKQRLNVFQSITQLFNDTFNQESLNLGVPE